MKSRTNFKRKLFVNKKLQALFSLYIALGFILATIFFAYELIKTYFSFWGFNTQNIKFLGFLNDPTVVRILILTIFTAVWYGISIVLTTNKFVGPLVRLNQILNKMKEGDFNISFKFRRSDKEYKHTEKILNELLAVLNENKTKRNKLLKDCETDLLHLSNKLKFDEEQQNNVLQILSDLKHSINECKKL